MAYSYHSKRKRQRYIVKGDWPDSKVQKLISAVRKRPELWISATNAFIKIPKIQLWEEVAAEVEEEFWKDCRAKWQNLRISYKCNLAKLTNRSQDPDTNESPIKVQWRFFDSMQFIDKHDAQVINQLPKFTFGDGFQSDDANVSNIEPMTSPKPGTSVSELPANGKWKNGDGQTHSRASSHKHNGVVLPIDDEYSVFGEQIAEELRGLSQKQASILKQQLNTTLLNFLNPSTSASATFKNGLSQNDIASVSSVSTEVSANPSPDLQRAKNSHQNENSYQYQHLNNERESFSCCPCSHKIPQENEFDQFGKVWAIDLQKMDPDQQLYAKRAIGEVLFEGQMGTLQRDSVKINDHHQYHNQHQSDEKSFFIIEKNEPSL